jgi:hypothetical protein
MHNIYESLPASSLKYFIQVIKHKPLALLRILKDKITLTMTQLCVNVLPPSRKQQFVLRGKKLKYITSQYNQSTYNERSVEVAVGLDAVKNHQNILEIGAVLPHYRKPTWDVVDKFELGKGIQNVDIIDFKPKQKYDYIISLSTFEHIGYDDTVKDQKKAYEAVEHVKKHCLKKGGTFLMSLPIGYNPHIHPYLKKNLFNMDRIVYLKRVNWHNEWQEVANLDIDEVRYSSPYNNANALAFCYYTSK